MIYTIGNEATYEEYITEDPNPCKRGRTKDYVGGSVWRTLEDAQKHIIPYYIVYGVLADWDKDTIKNNDGPWNDLLVDSPLVRLDNK